MAGQSRVGTGTQDRLTIRPEAGVSAKNTDGYTVRTKATGIIQSPCGDGTRITDGENMAITAADINPSTAMSTRLLYYSFLEKLVYMSFDFNSGKPVT